MFNTLDEAFLRSNLKDLALAQKFILEAKRRAIVAKIVVASFLFVTAIAIGYSAIKTKQTNNTLNETNLIKTEIDKCMMEAQVQASIAVEVRKKAELKNFEITEKLQACEKKSIR